MQILAINTKQNYEAPYVTDWLGKCKSSQNGFLGFNTDETS